MKKFFLIVFLCIILGGCAPNVEKNSRLNMEKEIAEPEVIISLPGENKDNFYSGGRDIYMYKKFINNADKIDREEKIKGGFYSAYLPAGHIDASFFNSLLSDNPELLILIEEGDLGTRDTKILSSKKNWDTVFGTVNTDSDLIEKISEKGLLKIDDQFIEAKFRGYSPIPFVAYYSNKTKILPLVLDSSTSAVELGGLIKNLEEILPGDTVVAAKVNLSSFLRESVAAFHDSNSIARIKRFNIDQISSSEIKTKKTVELFLALMQFYGAEKIVYEKWSNSAELSKIDKVESCTGYYWPYFSKGEKDENNKVAILHVGDIMLDRDVKLFIDQYGYDYILENIAGYNRKFFQGLDLVAGNLEGSFADYRRHTSKEIAFRFDPNLIPFLKKYNFNIFNLANNHILDMGFGGLEETIENLESADIDFYGAKLVGNDFSYIEKDINGLKIAFIGFDDVNSRINTDYLKKTIEKIDDTNDYVVVNIHWGNEYHPYQSNSRQQMLAHMMIDSGADVIIGHHPHVIQEIEVYKDKPIFYSLGNFIFDQYWSQETQEGLAVGMVLDRGDMEIYLYPVESKIMQVQLMDFEKTDKTIQKLIDHSRLGEYNFSNNFLKINISD
ncbi:MAG: AmmeMemoRadiSam system protein B [Candidatus Magasanikbacteria bacterium]|nr:AmmeMemoRadiSam system protein B [Candidatus Magasanikbacteria bacterium]